MATTTLAARRNLLRWARWRAKRKGLECDLTVDDIAVPTLCPVLGIPLQAAIGRPSDFSPSLDRIDPTRGYVRGNTLVVSLRANRLKGDATWPELTAIAAFYRGYALGQTYGEPHATKS